jgi:cyclophilin family peptidyl-prolyl cis-trans isomerase
MTSHAHMSAKVCAWRLKSTPSKVHTKNTRVGRQCIVIQASGSESAPSSVVVRVHDLKTSLVAIAAAACVTTPTFEAFASSAPGVVSAPMEITQVAGLEANPITNAKALLRNALPIENKPIRAVQKKLESISDDLRVPGVKFSGVASSVTGSLKIVNEQRDKIIADFAPAKKADGTQALKELESVLKEFQVVVEQKDKQEVPFQQQKALALVGQIEEDMINGFPYEVPKQYADRPLLKGRATVEMEVRIKDNANTNGGVLTIVLDGYNAPVTAGNFLDLINQGFYDGMDIQRSDGFVVQSGRPKKGDGYQVNGVERNVPLEIMVQGDKVPEYEFTLEDLGRYRAQPMLPFNAFGTLSMARRESEANSGSSQFFFLLRESELTPSGTNIMDGRYSTFGYVVENQELLRDLKVDDVIVSMKVVSGGENLINATPRAAPQAETAEAAVESAAQ